MKPYSGFTIALDPGHGGSDPGAIGVNGLKEYEVNLAVARRVRQYLSRLGFRVVMTHDGLPKGKAMSLADRVRVADEGGADYLVSIHANAASNPNAWGLEIWRQSTEPLGLPSQLLADEIYSMLLVTCNPNRRGVKTRLNDSGREYYGILRHAVDAGIPGVIVEMGFVTNPNEASLLAQDWYREKVALGITWGIARHVERFG